MDLDEFLLAPLNLPYDSREILRLHYQNYLSDPFYTSSLDTIQTEDEYINTRIESISEQFLKSSTFSRKVVLRDHPEKMVGYIVFREPQADSRTPEQKDKDLREQINKRTDGQKKKDQVYKLRSEEEMLTERYLGKGYENRWWCLDVLIVDENYQRRGLGSKLVTWGIEKVESSIRQWNDGITEWTMPYDPSVKKLGVYLLASPKGARTYEKAGFVRVGERELEFDGKGEEKYVQAWFIKRYI